MERDGHGRNTLREFRETTMELDNLYSFFPKYCGLSEPEYWSLLFIYEGMETQSEISERLFVSRQTLNSAFKQLLKKGLITLEPFADNLRAKRAVLTNQGRTLVEERVLYMHRVEERAWQKLSAQEQEMLARLTRIYADVLDDTLQDSNEKKEN